MKSYSSITPGFVEVAFFLSMILVGSVIVMHGFSSFEAFWQDIVHTTLVEVENQLSLWR